MNIRQKKYILCTALLLLLCSGCGKPMDAGQMQAVKNGYRIGTVGEEYYRLTVRAYLDRKPLPPLSSLHTPHAPTIEKICYQLDCLFYTLYLKFFPERDFMFIILQ